MPAGEGWDLPEGVGEWTDFHWFKVSGFRFTTLVFLTAAPTWYAGHFVDKRMVPCQGDGCRWCDEGVGQQARYVFPVVEVQSRKVGFIELSRSVALEIQDYASVRGGLIGLTVTFTKHTKHRQSRMETEMVPDCADLPLLAIPVPDVKRALLLTWEKAHLEIPKQLRDSLSSKKEPKATHEAVSGAQTPSTSVQAHLDAFRGKAKGNHRGS